MNRIRFTLDVCQDCYREAAAFLETFKFHNFFKFFDWAVGEVYGAINWHFRERNPENAVSFRPDVGSGGNAAKNAPTPQSVRRIYYGY